MAVTTPSRPLSSYKVLIFDVYGTVVDWETGIYTALEPILPAGWTREVALQAYTSVEKDLQAQHPELPYRDLLAKAHEVLAARFAALAGGGNGTLDGTAKTSRCNRRDVGTSASPAVPEETNQHTRFAAALGTWPVFPDSVAALRSLSKRYKLIVLSNVDRESFAVTHSQLSSGSESPFTLILTAQDTGVYKPSLFAFERALSLIGTQPEFEGVRKEDVLSVAQSLWHDHAPANKLGLGSVWIDRAGAVMGVGSEIEASVNWNWRFNTLGEMAEEVERELKEKTT